MDLLTEESKVREGGLKVLPLLLDQQFKHVGSVSETRFVNQSRADSSWRIISEVDKQTHCELKISSRAVNACVRLQVWGCFHLFFSSAAAAVGGAADGGSSGVCGEGGQGEEDNKEAVVLKLALAHRPFLLKCLPSGRGRSSPAVTSRSLVLGPSRRGEAPWGGGVAAGGGEVGLF